MRTPLMQNVSRARMLTAGLLAFVGISLGCGEPLTAPSSLVVTSITPNSAHASNSTSVRIRGTLFQPGATVTLGGPATGVRVVSSTEITAFAGAHPVGAVDVVVTNPNGVTGRLERAYTYTEDPPPPTTILVVFTDSASGFSTTDLRDAEDQIVQFSKANELIWTEDGRRLPGYPVSGNSINAEKGCNCWFEVRFGTKDGERRAYLTADYGHDNPGSIVDLEIVGGALVTSRTDVYPPGTFTLSGVVTEATPTGDVPVEGVAVYRGYSTGWLEAITDRHGYYRFLGTVRRNRRRASHEAGLRDREEKPVNSGRHAL